MPHYYTGEQIWQVWNIGITSTTQAFYNMGTATSTAVSVWNTWNQYYTGTSTGVYFDTEGNAVRNDGGWHVWNAQYVETEEQIAAREERNRIAEAQYQELRIAREEERIRTHAERQAAEQRARELLLSTLDAKQKRDLLESGWFDVISNKGRRFRIRAAGIAGNVDLLPEDEDVRLASFCGHPPNSGETGPLPNSDHYLAQKLAIETDEENFSNVSYIHYRKQGVPDAEIRGVA